MKTLFTTLSILLMTFITNAQDTIQLSDFEMLNSTKWEGQLSYKDFQSGEQKFVPATMQIKIENGKVVSNIQYTYEPHKNETSKVKIKNNGTYFGSEEVVSNTFENGTRTIVTKYEGKDNNKAAIQFRTYQFNDNTFTKTKEVQYIGEEERFVRNGYTFKRIQ